MILLLICLLLPGLDSEAANPAITAKSAVIMSSDGVVLWEQNPGFACPPASTTKVMTALVALQKLPIDSWLKVSRNAEETEASKAGIKEGEEFRTSDLLHALLMSSANDVAVCLAENAAGSEDKFAEWMTEQASKLGAKKTVFKNASGLPAEGQFTTARDLAAIMKKALSCATIVSALKTKALTIKSRGGREIELSSHNRLLWDGRYSVVLKTGFTRASKHCYVGFFGPDGRGGIFAFLMAKKPWDDVRTLSAFASAGGPVIEFNRTKLDSSQVSRVQKALQQKGFDPGPADGVFGLKTLRALERFQASARLKPDGIADAATLRKLGL